jgi:hypothetical protein
MDQTLALPTNTLVVSGLQRTFIPLEEATPAAVIAQYRMPTKRHARLAILDV